MVNGIRRFLEVERLLRRNPVTKGRDKDNQILQRLGEWKQKDGTLPQFIELYSQLLSLQIGVKSRLAIPKPGPADKTIADQLKQGLPLLRFGDLSLDWSLVQEQLRAVIAVLTEHLTPELGNAKGLRNLTSDMPLLQQAVKDWYQGLPLSAIATEQCVSESLLSAALQATLRPFLVAHSEVLLPLVKQELWRRGYCPVCGGRPDFAFLDKERGARWLLCSRCDAEWLFQRLQCPYCGTQNHSSLAYLTDEKQLYRLYTCEECRSYIKAIDLRNTESEILLPLERVLTMDLDRQADEAGYQAG
jgi:FdhE protein